jgi:hypothetical protein
MSFSPNLFLSNIRGKDGLAKPCRFEVILPIPPYVNQFVGNSIIEKILNLPNSIFSDVSSAIGSAFGRQGESDEFSKHQIHLLQDIWRFNVKVQNCLAEQLQLLMSKYMALLLKYHIKRNILIQH